MINIPKAIDKQRIPTGTYEIGIYTLLPLVLIIIGAVLALYTCTHNWTPALKAKNYLPVIGLSLLALTLIFIGLRLLLHIGRIFKLVKVSSNWQVDVKDAFLSTETYTGKQLKLTPVSKPQIGEYHFTYRRNFATIQYNVIILIDENGFYINVRHPEYRHTSNKNLKVANRLKNNLLEILSRVEVRNFNHSFTEEKIADMV